MNQELKDFFSCVLTGIVVILVIAVILAVFIVIPVYVSGAAFIMAKVLRIVLYSMFLLMFCYLIGWLYKNMVR